MEPRWDSESVGFIVLVNDSIITSVIVQDFISAVAGMSNRKSVVQRLRFSSNKKCSMLFSVDNFTDGLFLELFFATFIYSRSITSGCSLIGVSAVQW